MNKLTSLNDLLVDELRHLHSAENQLVKALPKLAKAAHAVGLKEAFEHHLEETRGHVERLDRVFAQLGIKPAEKKCKVMESLVNAGAEMIEAKTEPAIRDAGLIGAAQRVEHYEMGAYGTLRDFAALLGMAEVAALLQETLDEEHAADKTLTGLAKSINLAAIEEGREALAA